MAFACKYERGNSEYQRHVAHYYPSDGIIDIGSFSYDLAGYLGDYALVFKLYKRNTARAIVASTRTELEHGEATQEVERSRSAV